MTEPATRDHAGRASADDVRLRADEPKRHGEILMALRHRRVQAIAEKHFPPPSPAEFPHRAQAGLLRFVSRLLGPCFVERLQTVVAPHPSGQMEAALDLQFARIDGPAGGDELLRTLRLVVGGGSGRGVGGSGRLQGCRCLRTESRRQTDLGVGPERFSGPVGERFQPHQVEGALVLGQRFGRGVGERGDPVKPERTFVLGESRGDLVGDRLETIHPYKLGVRCEGYRHLWRKRRETIEPEHPFVLPDRFGGPFGKLLQAGEPKKSPVCSEQFNLSVGYGLQSRQPQIAAVLPHQLCNLVGDGLQAPEREGSRVRGGDEGPGGVERQFNETVQLEEGVWLRQGGGRLRRE